MIHEAGKRENYNGATIAGEEDKTASLGKKTEQLIAAPFFYRNEPAHSEPEEAAAPVVEYKRKHMSLFSHRAPRLFSR